jgi:glycosyltransferase involved in cell wall biosynthesis
MRIAFIHPRFPSAEGTGATHSATQIVTGLADAGHDIRVYCPQLPEEPGTTGLELRHLAGNSRHPHTNTRLNREIVSRLNELRQFDIVHSYLMSLLPSIAQVGEDPDVKTVVTLNAYGGTCAKNDLLYLNQEQCQNKSTLKCLNCIAQTGFENDDNSFLYRSASKLFSLRLIDAGESRLDNIDAFRAPSDHVRSNYVQFGYDHDKISVIPHPVDDDFRVPHQSGFTEPYRLLYVGALSKHKGVEKLVPILAGLNDGEMDFELTIVGTGGMEQTLRNQAEKLGVTDVVDFAGFVPNKELPGVYAHHDIFVFPALWEEPLARVYLESLATGTPIITSEYGSISEIIGEGGVTVIGSPESYINKIDEVTSRDHLECLSEGGKRSVEKYELLSIISQIEDLYKRIRGSK